jgi:hypothetical protein
MSSEFNVRDGYGQILSDYIKYLPSSSRNRNLLFADQEARILRDLFAADAEILPPEFAARLRAMLQGHIWHCACSTRGLSDFTMTCVSAEPIDAVERITAIVAEDPEVFDISVGQALSDAAQPLPASLAEAPHGPPHGSDLQPPPDPLGTLPTEKAQGYMRAGTINRLWAVFQKGEALNKNSDAWAKMGRQLVPHVRPILEWLSTFFSSGPPPS